MSDPITLLFAPGVADDPHPTYQDVLSRCPVVRQDHGESGAVYISRFEDVMWALRHPEVFSSSDEALSMGQTQPLIPLQVDPPLHTDYRRLLNPEFVPRKINELEADARVLVNQLIDRFVDRGECDFHEEFATPLPSTIFLRLMRLPAEDLPTFLQWRDNTIRPDVAPGDYAGAAAIRDQTGKDITAYFQAAIDQRRRQPDDGLLSQLVHATMNDGRPLTDVELLGMAHLLLLGGLDTVTATLDCMVVRLAHHPGERRQLVERPELVAPAVEELLRHQTPVQVVPRVMAQDFELGGVQLRKGDRVTLVLGAANADAGEFGQPDQVDLGRDPNRHVAFGAGHHLCLGAHLARLELRVALEEFHRRIPDYAIPEGTEIHFSGGIRQADRLPLAFPVSRA